MRERKMRYWDSKLKKMEYEPMHYTFDGEHVNVNMLLNNLENERDDWSDWIGRQDDFGNDIYEGDYLEITVKDDDSIRLPVILVTYFERFSQFVGEDEEGELSGIPGIGSNFHRVKVIGNKWEGIKNASQQ